MILTRINADAQVTIPQEVMAALGLKPGDEIGFTVSNGAVSLFRNPSDDEIDGDTGLTYGVLRALIKEAVDDPRPSVPAEQAFAELRAHIDSRRQERRAAQG